MNYKEQIEKAQEHFDGKEYIKSMEICSALLNEELSNHENMEVFILSAKCFLFLKNSPKEDAEKFRDAFISSVSNAGSYAETVEDVKRIDCEMGVAYAQWHNSTVQMILEILEKSPNLNNWREYLSICREYFSLWMEMFSIIRKNKIIDEHCAKEGITKKDCLKSWNDHPNGGTLDTDTQYDLEYETGKKIFDNTKELYFQNADSNPEYLKSIVPDIINAFVTAELAVKKSASETITDTETINERLKTAADIITFLLNATIYPNGKPLSLYVGDRQQYVNEIKDIYDKIRKNDTGFIPPALPSVEAITPVAQSQSSGGGGGCYVATAVYGSYDCPQVWTLRRYRDYTLAVTWYGRAFIRTYYAISPTLVKLFGKTEWFGNLWKPRLDRLVERLNADGIESTPYSDRNW